MSGCLRLRLPEKRTLNSIVRVAPCSRFLSNKGLLAASPFRRVGTLTRRQLAALEDDLINHVGNDVIDPVLGRNMKDLNWLGRRLILSEEDDSITVSLRLPSLLHPRLQELQQRVRDSTVAYLKERQQKHSETGFDTSNVHVNASPEMKPIPSAARQSQLNQDQAVADELLQKLGPGLANVSHFVCVYSCKGGVGKSTIAVNLAYELAMLGGRVGLLDVDVYGPSLPILVQPDDTAVRPSPLGQNMVYPINHAGVKLLSLGHVSPTSGVPGSGPGGGASVMRGPLAGRVVTQLLKGTDWGPLDVLLLDLPPGTGDVQLVLGQELPLSGAVAVTTPSKVALADARKGIEMFDALGVRTLAVVENMSYFVCEGGGKHYPFGKGLNDGGSDNALEAPHTFSLPISTLANDANDVGRPLSFTRPNGAEEELEVFGKVAQAVAHELFLTEHDVGASVDEWSTSVSRVQFPKQRHTEEYFDLASTYLAVDNEKECFTARFFGESGALEFEIDGQDLRSRDPKTGEAMEQPAPSGMVHQFKVHRSFPVRGVERKGHYGYSVEFADGATVIYSMLAIAKIAGGEPGTNQ